MRRWIVFLPVAILAFFSTPLEARATGGLNVTAYVVDSTPPLRQDGVYPVCNTLVYENIQQGWGSGDVAGCLYQHDRVMLHYEGNIVIPEDAPYVQFLIMSDDGGVIDIAGGSYGYWGDRGCSYSASPVLYLPTNVEIPIDAWFYENGGGTCFYLYWNIGNGFEVVPPSAFSAPVPTTTTSTTTLPPTTLPETTTTVEESTTTSATTTSSSSSSVPESSSSSSSSSSVVETSSSVSSSSLVETSVPESSSSVQQTSTTTQYQPPVTTTTLHDFVPEPSAPTEQAPTPQQPMPENTVPETTTPEELSVDTTFVQDTVVEVPLPDNEPLPSIEIIDVEESAPETTNPPVEDAITSPPDTLGSDMSVVEPETMPDTGGYTEEQIAEAIVSIINNDPSTITTEQVAILVSEGVFEKLSDEQLEMVAETLSSAPDEVKELFEESIDVFSGKVDNYVPLGSTVSVGKRRVLNAVTATLFVMSAPIPVASSRKQ